MNKKLQVFVSSTYTDLIEERQAAVQAILDAGHIPAGMELFKAGKSQMQTIQRWIDESDVYMLILGGRYGSIEEESGLSYTELEYNYAITKKMPVFAVILSEPFLTKKIGILGLSNTIEQKSPDKYQTFKSLVMSKIIKPVDDCKDIKITIHSTLNTFINENTLLGWIRNSNNLSNTKLQREKTHLKSEQIFLEEQNDSLKEQYHSLKEQNDSLKKQNDFLEEQNDSLKEQYHSLKEQNDSLCQKLVEAKDLLNSFKTLIDIQSNSNFKNHKNTSNTKEITNLNKNTFRNLKLSLQSKNFLMRGCKKFCVYGM